MDAATVSTPGDPAHYSVPADLSVDGMTRFMRKDAFQVSLGRFSTKHLLKLGNENIEAAPFKASLSRPDKQQAVLALVHKEGVGTEEEGVSIKVINAFLLWTGAAG